MSRPSIRQIARLALVFVCGLGALTACADTDPGTSSECEGENCGGTGSDAGDSCTDKSDCPVGETCQSGTCQPAGGCATNADCAGDRVCRSGSCYDPAPEDAGNDGSSDVSTDASGDDGGSTGSDAGDVGDATGDGGGDGGGTCNGCFVQTDAGSRRCVSGDDNEACGSGGVTCSQCTGEESCKNGSCVAPKCSPARCAGCCENGECKEGNTDQACGTDGDSCSDCGTDSTCVNGSCELTCQATCAGCCENGTCQSGDSDSACGTGGDTCSDCDFDEKCQNGTCALEACSERCSTGCCDGSDCKSGLSDNNCGVGGDACESCQQGFTCKSLGIGSRGGDCKPADDSRWDVIAVRGKVPKTRKVNSGRGQTTDSKWDSFSKPDVRLHVKVTGQTQTHKAKTKVDKDDLTPEWGQTTVSDVRAEDLRSFDDTELRLMDDDVLADDHIATCKTQFFASHFDGNVHKFECKEDHAGEEITTDVYLRLQYHP